MSIISSGTTTTNSIVLSPDTTGKLVFKTGASSNTALTIDASQAVGIGGDPSTGTTGLSIFGANQAINSLGQLCLISTSNAAIDYGSQIALGGSYSGNTYAYWFGNIAGRKENSVDGDVSGYLALATTNSSGVATEAMRISSLQRVGIGTSSPAYKLQVAGTVGVSGIITSTVTAGQVLTAASGTTAIIYNNFVNTGGTLSYGIDNSTGSAIFSNSSNYAGFIGTTGATPLVLATNSAVRATIDSSGNLGLGVTPDSIGSNWKALELANGIYLASYTGSTNADMYLGCNNYWNGTAFIGKVSGYNATQYEQYQGQHRWWNTNGSNVTGGSSFTFTQAMTLDNAGHLSLNTTQIYGFLTIASDINSVKTALVLQNTSSSNAGAFLQFLNSAVGVAGSITQTGATSVNYGSGSDYRLKENIQPMTGALAKVNQLNPVTFDWIADKTQGQGFIAHELQVVVPECVYGEKDAVDSEGNLKYQMVDQSKLVGVLTKAIQELSAQVTTLQTQVTALQAKG